MKKSKELKEGLILNKLQVTRLDNSTKLKIVGGGDDPITTESIESHAHRKEEDTFLFNI